MSDTDPRVGVANAVRPQWKEEVVVGSMAAKRLQTTLKLEGRMGCEQFSSTIVSGGQLINQSTQY